MFVTNWISTTKIQKISEITNFFRHYFLSRTEVRKYKKWTRNPTIFRTFVTKLLSSKKKGRSLLKILPHHSEMG